MKKIKEIIAKMRERADDDDYTPDCILGQTLNCFADELEVVVAKMETPSICKCLEKYSAQRMLSIYSKGIAYHYGFKTTEDADMVLDILSKCTEQEIEKHSDEWKTIGDRIYYSETPF